MTRSSTALHMAGVIILWGSSFLLSKIALTQLAPMSLALYRWAFACAGLWAGVAWSKEFGESLQLARARPWTLATLGLIGVTSFYALQNAALRHTSTVHVGVLISLNPVFIALLSTLLLRERLRRFQWFGILLAATGAAIVVGTRSSPGVSQASWLGDGLTLLSAICWAVYSVMGRRILSRHDALQVTAVAAVWGTIWLVPCAAGEGFPSSISASTWAVVGLLGLLCSALAYVLWFRVLAVVPASRAGLYLFLVPLVASALSVTFLHEPLTFRTGLGAALVLGGVACTQRAGYAVRPTRSYPSSV